jgi:hypothetical protein
VALSLMSNVKLLSFIDDPHQKFYYTFNFDRPFDFHVELMKIILDEDPKLTYPYIVKSVGEAPKQFTSTFVPSPTTPAADDFDFLNEMEFVPEDAEDFSEVTDTGVDEEEETHGVDAEDDEMDEFSDNEHMEDEEHSGRGGHDDY